MPVWPDLAKFRHFGKTFQVFGKFLTVYFLFGKVLSLFWQIWFFNRLILIVANGQILKNNLTIWSHCSIPTYYGSKAYFETLIFFRPRTASSSWWSTWTEVISCSRSSVPENLTNPEPDSTRQKSCWLSSFFTDTVSFTGLSVRCVTNGIFH